MYVAPLLYSISIGKHLTGAQRWRTAICSPQMEKTLKLKFKKTPKRQKVTTIKTTFVNIE